MKPLICSQCGERPVAAENMQLCRLCYDLMLHPPLKHATLENLVKERKIRLDALIEGVKNGLTLEEMAAGFDISVTHARNLLKANGTPFNALSPTKRERLAALIEGAKNGLTLVEMAARHEISVDHVRELLKLNGTPFKSLRPPKPKLPRKKRVWPTPTVEERVKWMTQLFLENVDATADGCWKWHGKYHKPGFPLGYGYDPLDSPVRRTTYAYRVAHLLFIGPIPVGMLVMRTCGNHQCVNPKHLKLTTRVEHGRTINPRAQPK